MTQALIAEARRQVAAASATEAIHTRVHFASFGVFNRGKGGCLHPGYDCAK